MIGVINIMKLFGIYNPNSNLFISNEDGIIKFINEDDCLNRVAEWNILTKDTVGYICKELPSKHQDIVSEYYSIYASIRNQDGIELARLQVTTRTNSMIAESTVEHYGRIWEDHSKDNDYCSIPLIKSIVNFYESQQPIVVFMKELIK